MSIDAAEGAKSEEKKLAPEQIAFFENQVRPILIGKCYECHSQEAKILQGGLLLDSKPGWMKGGDSGVAVVPGKPEESLLVRAVRYEKNEHVQMPPKGKMSDAEIGVLVEWVKRGAPDPRVEAPLAAKKRTIDVEAGKKHWAFLPLAEPKPPTIAGDSWSRTPVDAFIRRELDRVKLRPNDVAERRTLVRRAYFDLLGLPPKPEEVDAFVNDKSADAYEKLIDKLLANPHFGERWGRHWLDLARFAESHGFEQDYDRPNAYHYRDFVIRAFNQDLPYDKFVKWQIAGDEYEPDNPLALMATGFLAAGVHATQITANQAEKERYDELDDMARTIGTTMLGITIGCARCHDHKFDPFTQADYFRMVSTFTTTVRSDYDVNLDPAGYRKQLAAWEPPHRPLAEALAQYERNTLAPKFDAWLTERSAPGGAPTWIVATPTKTTAPEPIKFTTLEDGSVQARGSQFFGVKYAVTLETAHRDIRALRLEALADDGLPGGGPGMGLNGSVKVKLQINAAPKQTGTAVDGVIVSRTVEIPPTKGSVAGSNAQSTVAANPESWEITGEGRDVAAVFELKEPLGFDGGTKLNITLDLAGNNQGLGRFRLALATGAGPHPLAGSEISEAAQTALRKLTAERNTKPSSAERDVLFAWFRTQDPEWIRLHRIVAASELKRPKPQVAKMLISSEGVPAVRLHTQGPDFYEKTFVVRRGDPNQKVEEARPGFVSVLVRGKEDERWRSKPPAEVKTSYRRRGLAEWMTDVDSGAGHLLARVIVNRLWYYHMGTGLTANPSDFGVQSAKPMHAELLDYLARELIRNDWRLKPMHKLIMTSAVYMQTSASDAARTKADPENSLFWHKPLRRLEGEIVRDAIMAVAGTLDETMFGPGTLAADQPRRSIYFFVKRSKLVPMMSLFDGPDTLQDLAVRPETTVAPQALMLMNNEILRRYADAFAKKIMPISPGDIEQGIDTGYRRAIGRSPSEEELRDSKEFVAAQIAAYRGEGKAAASEALAWSDFCQVLFGLNEFVFVE
ncbi:MAG: PSD1 and planctomycete cytochrome C domain-containing protein [Planctomycetia bacterium]|nr:PSD1 and planctomycete cytochrome C domain-containing protein [Planctomycetia bacterium]